MDLFLLWIFITVIAIAIAVATGYRARARRLADELEHEVWMHASCLSIAEGAHCFEHDAAVKASNATKTVFRLRKDFDNAIKEIEAVRGELQNEKRLHDGVLKTHFAHVSKTDETIESLKREVHRLAVPLRPPALEGMDTDDFRAAFDVDDDTPLWQALHQLLDAEIVQAVDDVAPAPSGVFTADVRTHSAGELNALREFQKTLLRWRREARRAKQQTAAAAAGSD